MLTFEPHPRELFSPLDAPARLTSLREKLLLLGDNGVDHAHVQPFNNRFSTLSAEGFIQSVLVDGLKVRHLLIGDDFRFGERRNGDFALLQAAGSKHGFGVEAMPTLSIAGERASSSAVRCALETGNLSHAARLLGRPYSIAGQVSHGSQLGRQIGFPTLNIVLKNRRPALSGVFTVEVEGLGRHPPSRLKDGDAPTGGSEQCERGGRSPDLRVKGVANIGIRPTVGNTPQSRLEVHLLDWSGDCYGAHLQVHFFHRLRDETRFPSLDALKAQIGLDVQAARGWFSQHFSNIRTPHTVETFRIGSTS